MIKIIQDIRSNRLKRSVSLLVSYIIIISNGP